MKKLLTLLLLAATIFAATAQTKLWGLTSLGGDDGLGTIFNYVPSTGLEAVQHSLASQTSGAGPGFTALVDGGNGKFYGTTNAGGAFNNGVIFEWDPATNIYTKKVDFDGINGRLPQGLTLMAGKFYGITTSGGVNGTGVIFEWDPATNTCSKKMDFVNSDGDSPYGSLMLMGGKFYGTTYTGGTNNQGVIYEWNPATNVYTKKIDFTGINGASPLSGLTLSGSIFYGVTYQGGTTGQGVIFEWDPATNAITVKINLTDAIGTYPYAALTESAGKFYGVTTGGGANGDGVIFEWDPSTNTYAKKVDFASGTGYNAYGSLSLHGNKLYGLTALGGTGSAGSIFEWDILTNAYNPKVYFNSTNGINASGSLLYSGSKFYGMTGGGGINNSGVIFEWDVPSNTYTKKIDFNTNNGANTYGSLTANGSKLYGMASRGGAYGIGVIFECDPATNVYTKKIDLDGTNGAYPFGALTLSGGKVYGMTYGGGANEQGVIFEWDPNTNTYTKKIDFDDANGTYPTGSLTASGDKLYGLTQYGGANGSGVIFEWDPATNIYTKKVDLTSANGANPSGSLSLSGGKFYGMTHNGGAGNYGVIFEWDPVTNVLIKKFDFDNTNGSFPQGSLTLSGAAFYGMTNNGGASDMGVLFEWNPATNSYLKKADFTGANGANPMYGHLAEYGTAPLITTGSISGPFCTGANVNVPYTATGIFNPGNIFTAQLSNASGSFATPVNIGTLANIASGTINATIPAGSSGGTGYRIRVVSNNPSVTGTNNGGNLTISTSPFTWYQDADNDGWYGNTQSNCSSPGPGWYLTLGNGPGDCNDADPNIHPGATYYKDIDGDLYSDGITATGCPPPAGYYTAASLTATSGDCNDNAASIHPGAVETVGNGIDDNCNGQTDELVYCTDFSSSYSYCYSSITHLSLGSINNTTGCETAGYGNYTAQAATLTLGTPTAVSVTASSAQIAIFADLNQDGDFTDAGELLVPSTGLNGTAQYSFTIPLGTQSGNIRLRVMSDYYAVNDPCHTYYGEAEDYTIIIPCTSGCNPGAALDFDGVNDYVNIGTQPALNFTGNFTVETWVKQAAGITQNYPAFISNWTISGSAESGYWLGGDAAGHAVFYYSDGTNGHWIVSTANIDNGAWHHVAGVNNAGTFEVYVDGILSGSAVGPPVAYTLPIATWLGSDAANELLNGQLDEVRFWNIARSQAQIQSTMNCEIPTTTLGLIANYHFNLGQAGANNAGIVTVLDATCNSFNGTLTNFTLSGNTSNWAAPGAVVSGSSCAVSATSCSNTWKGGSTIWTNASNWTIGVPTGSTDAVIPTTPVNGNNFPLITGAVAVNDLTVQSGATTMVNATGVLTLNGVLANAGAIIIQNGGNFMQNGTYNGAGIFKVEKSITNTANGYRDISSPVVATVADLADDFAVSGQDGVQCWYSYNPYPNIQVYNEALSIVNGNFFEGWLSRTGTGNVLSPMQGVAIRTYQGAPFTLDFTGSPNNGAQSINITNTTTGTPSQDGWNFVGNPYPSNIDWVAVAAMNPSITGSYYVYNTSGEYTGNFGTCNAGGVCTGIGGLTRYISSGQGFFVRKTTQGSGTFVLNNTVRNATATNFYKTDAMDNEIRLSITDGVNSDEILAYTDVNATIGDDQGLDAEKIAAGGTAYMAFALPDNDYAIDVLDIITEQTVLPLIIHVTDSGNYTITANSLNVTGLTAYLNDALNDTLYDLSVSSPSFTLVGAQSYTGRFSVVFKQAVVSGVATNNEPVTKIYSQGNRVFVERTSIAPATIAVANVLGQQLTEKTTQLNKTEIQVASTELAYLFVKVTEGTKVTVAKVLISNK